MTTDVSIPRSVGTTGAPPVAHVAARRGLPRWVPSWRRALLYLFVLIILFISLFPFYWIVRTSLESNAAVAQGVSGLGPIDVTISSYVKDFTQQQFLRPLINSAIVSLAATAVTVVFGSLAGYALARLPIRGAGAILGFILLAGFFPVLAMVGPLFLLYRHLGFLDSDYPLILVYLVYTLPIATWLLKNFFAQIPKELEEAALVDGATRLQALRRVVIPVAVPGVFTAAILAFILAWNDFLFAVSFLQTPSKFTAPLAIVNLGQSKFQVFYNRIDAAVVIISIPIAVIVLLAQRRIVSGLTAGALK
ncbi:MAG: carbohydrate ABC transporter permease [Acidimicrobiales bacterium]